MPYTGIAQKPGSKNNMKVYVMPIRYIVQFTRRVQKTMFFDLASASSALLHSQINNYTYNCSSMLTDTAVVTNLQLSFLMGWY